MSDIERDAEELGRRIQPNPAAAYGRVQRRRLHRAWRLFGGRRMAGALVTAAAASATLSLVLVGALASWGPLAEGHPLGTAQHSTGSTTGGAAPAAGVYAPGDPQRAGNGAGPVSSANGGRASTAPVPTSGRASASPTGAPYTLPGPRTPPPTPAPSNGNTNTITITDQSSGQIYVSRGTRVDVSLTGHSPYRWSVPMSSNTRVLTPVSSSTDTNGDATGVFIASASGESTISATDSPVCSPQCGAPSRLWSVTITVT